jgi:hypothetical protein
MTINLIGKILFPRQQPWLQRRRAITVVITLGVAVGFAGIVAGLIYFGNTRH